LKKYINRSNFERENAFKNVIAHELGHHIVANHFRLESNMLSIRSRQRCADDISGSCNLIFFRKFQNNEDLKGYLQERMTTICAGVAAQYLFIYKEKYVNNQDVVTALFGKLWEDYGADDLSKLYELVHVFTGLSEETFENIVDWTKKRNDLTTNFINMSLEILESHEKKFVHLNKWLVNHCESIGWAGFQRSNLAIDEEWQRFLNSMDETVN
jgi:hypothetical protein